MDDDVRKILGLTGDGYPVQPLFGSFVSLDSDGTYTVDVQDTRLTQVSPATPFRPVVGDRVALLLIGQVAYLIGPASALPPQGVVKSVTSTTAVITTDMGDVTATYTQGATLNTGATVKLYWSGGAHVIGALAVAPAPVPPPPPQQGGATDHTDTFTTLDAGSWSASSGWWQSQVWASDSTIGAWFYGSKISDTIQGGKVKSIQIWLPIVYKFGNPPVFGTHTYTGKPGGTPSIQNGTAVTIGGSGWYDLPVSFGQALASSPGGIGLNHGGFNKFASRSQDPQTGALRIVSTY